MAASGFSKQKTAFAALALVALAAVGTYGFIRFANSTPEISVVDYNSDWAKLWNGESFTVGGQPGDHIRPVLTPLKSGKHMLFADRSQIVRFFAPFEVKPGKNLLEIKFEREELPGMWRRVEFDTEKNVPVTQKFSEDYEYTSYDADRKPKENKAHIDLDLTAERDPENDKRVKFTASWTVILNGQQLSKSSLTDYNMLDNPEVNRVAPRILWSDDFHYFYLGYYMSGYAAEFTLEANFADYKGR